MQLNTFERAMMNNPVRVWLQRTVEAPAMLSNTSLPPRARLLEIGTGRGVGALLIAQRYDADEVVATDYDPDMLAKARGFVARDHSWLEGSSSVADRIVLRHEDATQLSFEDDSFDAVFAFLVLHHIRAWRDAVREIWRVLKPGGQLILDEVYQEVFRFPINVLFPPEALIHESDFLSTLTSTGFRVKHYQKTLGFGVLVAEKRTHGSV